MKKHIFAFICVFVLMFNTFTYTETKAMDIGVAIDVGSEILYESWDMIQSIFNGFVISLGQYSGYADKASAMAAFYNDWGDVLTVLTGGYLSPAEVEQPAISVNTVMPRDFGMTGAVMRDFIFNYGGFIADPNLGMYADVNMKSLASWNRYNDLYVKVYQDAFQKDLDSHPVSPDPDYQSYIDNMNYHGTTANSFWFYNNDTITGSDTFKRYVKNTPISYYSYVVSDLSSNINSLATPNLFVYDLLSIDIVSYNGSYSIYEEITPLSEAGYSIRNYNQRTSYSSVNFHDTAFGLSGLTIPSSIVLSVNGTLSDCFDYLTRRVRNVNIYVDGVLWAYVGQVQEPIVNLGMDHPRFDENGQMIGNDVYFPEQDLKADLVKFTELIDDKILTGDDIGLDDLIDAGILTDAEGNILTDENRDEYIKTRDISSVITDVLDDTDLADLLPDAPDPPSDDPLNWHFPTIVIPEGGDPDPRGTGISVLARIINVTNQSLPGEVITMFWGICITMLILGIIKILHK